VPPDALDAGVFDLCRPHQERPCGKYHRVVIEQQVVCKRNSTRSDNEGQCYVDARVSVIPVRPSEAFDSQIAPRRTGLLQVPPGRIKDPKCCRRSFCWE
jgi:hypothetical protein